MATAYPRNQVPASDVPLTASNVMSSGKGAGYQMQPVAQRRSSPLHLQSIHLYRPTGTSSQRRRSQKRRRIRRTGPPHRGHFLVDDKVMGVDLPQVVTAAVSGQG